MNAPARDTRLLFNVGVLGLSQASAQFLNVVALLLVARILGAEQFGVVQIGVALSAYVLLISEMGLMSLGIRDLSRLTDLRSIRRYVESHLGLLAGLAVATLGVGWFVLPTLPFFDRAPAVYLIYLALVLPQLGMLDWVSNGLQNQKWTGIFWVTRSALYALAIWLVLPREGTLLGLTALVLVPLAYWVAHLLADAVLWVRIQAMLGGGLLVPRLDRAAWRLRLSDAAPIGGSLIVMRILYNADILLLGTLADTTSAGIYAAASKLVQVLVIGAEVVWKVLLPRLSQLWSSSPAAFAVAFNRYAGLAVVALTPVAVGGTQLADGIVALIYRDAFAAAAVPLARLAVAYPLLALGIFLGNGLIARDRQRRYLPSVAVAATTMVGLNLVLIPRAAESGASWAVLIASAVLVATTGWQLRDQLRAALWRPLAAAAVAGGAMAMAIRLIDAPVVVAGSGGLAVYGVIAGPLVWRLVRPS